MYLNIVKTRFIFSAILFSRLLYSARGLPTVCVSAVGRAWIRRRNAKKTQGVEKGQFGGANPHRPLHPVRMAGPSFFTTETELFLRTLC